VTDGLSEGTIVIHPTLGLGKILLRDGDSAWVYFKDVEGEPKDAIKKLILSMAKLAPAPKQTDPVLDNLPPMVHGGKVVPPDRIRLTEKQAVNLFIEGYKSFEDTSYLKRERNYKWEAHEDVRSRLLKGPGRKLAQADSKNQLPKLLGDLIHATNLLAVQEVIRLNNAFKEPGAAQSYARGVLGFVDEPSAETFDRLIDAVSGLPAEPGSGVLTWPIVTLLPFLAEPKRHMFLKPQMTQRVADVFMFDLLYDSKPTWATYQRLLRLSEMLLNRLRPLGARDFIDVQSFMWAIEGRAYMKTKVKKAKSKKAKTKSAR
jgi:hypothetical protein